MSFLNRILRRRTDPTREWAPFRPPAPDFDLRTMQFGTLRFGASFDEAAFLGRPDAITWTQPEYAEMLYARGGFQIDFDQGQLAYLAFFIGPDRHLPKHQAMTFSRPRLHGATPEGISLSPEVNRAFLESVLGPAESVDNESGEMILAYTRQGIVMEFEMTAGGVALKRGNLYPR